MKKKIFIIFCLFIFFINCKKNETLAADTTSAGVDEAHLKSSGVDLTFKNGTGDLTTKSFTYNSLYSGDQTLSFTFDTLDGIVGEYVFSANNYRRYMQLTICTSYYSSFGVNAAGSIKILSIDRRTHIITGTFSLTLADVNGKTAVYEGAFNICYLGACIITAKKNGCVWKGTAASVDVSTSSIITLGSPNCFESIYINVPASIAPGTYAFTQAGSQNVTYASGQSYYVGRSGTLVITTCDKEHKTMKGTFSFVAKSNADTTQIVTFTEGVFQVQSK